MKFTHAQTNVLHQQDPGEQLHLQSGFKKHSDHSNPQSQNILSKIEHKIKELPVKILSIVFALSIACVLIAGSVSKKAYHPGASAYYNVSTEQMINNADLQKIFAKLQQKQEISRQKFIQAIRKLDITNYVKFGGQVYDQKHPQQNTRIENFKALIKEQTDYMESTYNLSEHDKNEMKFCVVVPSYRNIENGLYLRNLNSIFMQNYTNYHVVYVDDGSEDDTQFHVNQYINDNNIPPQKIQIVVQKTNKKPVYTIYNAINKYCHLGQIALIVQGDDALIGTNVFKLYNAIYQKEKCAMAYSSYLEVVDNSKVQLGVGRQLLDQEFEQNAIRSLPQLPGRYLLSFYVDIFKSIKDKDFQDEQGYFYWYTYDQAFIIPLLQISHPRIKVLKEILYEHRRTPVSESTYKLMRESNAIRLKKPYKPLKFFPFLQKKKYKYFFDVPIQTIIKNTDFGQYSIFNNFQIQGVTKNMHIQAIKLTEVIHNVRFGGEIVVQLAEYDKQKQEKQSRIQKLLFLDKQYYNSKYNIDFYRKNELPFCIVTPSYNNVKSGLYLRNLDSMFMQDYNNYHIVYIDDCSPEKTGEFVNKYLDERKIPQKHIEVIINKENKKAMYNLHMGIHNYCKPGEIVVIIDGDDSFIGRNVLSLYNAIYQREKAAMAYSNFLTIHNNDRTQLGFCHDINKTLFEQVRFRKTWDLPGTHLMSFYSDLFRMIQLTDLTYENGTFFEYAYDRAILTPLLQMAYPRISVIKEITYEYRNDTGINDAPNEWIRVSNIILKKQPYDHLSEFPFIRNMTTISQIQAGKRS